ncbi:predicted protein, partial [Nematostella vectensis]
VSRRNVENSLRISLVYLELEPLRLHVSVVKKVLSEAIQYFHDTFRVRQTVERIILDRRCLNDSYFLKNATGDGPGKVRFCKVACDASKPLCGPRNVPRSDVAACRVCNEHGEDCHAENNSSSGVGKNDTDFVLYVTASMEKCEKRETLAYAAVCQQEGNVDRPVAGFLNICPDKMNVSNDQKELLATFKHEIFHALGFSPSLYAFFRYDNGTAITPRSDTGMPPYDLALGRYTWSDRTIKTIERKDWMIRTDKGNNGMVSHTVQLMVTPRVQQEVQDHFNCSSLEGAELENQGGPGTELAHWEKRVFENEGMTGAFTQNAVFSRVTLALMEDTGWYRSNFKMAETLRWGKNLGCLFVNNSCKAWLTQQQRLKEKAYPFCQTLKNSTEAQRTYCSNDKTSVAMCNLAQYTQPLPVEYQYFESLAGINNPGLYGGSVDLADFCPYYQGFVWTSKGAGLLGSYCLSSSNQKTEEKNYGLEYYGSDAKCFLQGQVWEKSKCAVRWISVDWGSGCYKYRCDQDGLKIIIGGLTYQCYHPGQVLSIEMQSSDGWLHKGSIVCPSCQDIC